MTARNLKRPAPPLPLPLAPQVNQEESELVYRAPAVVEVDDDAFASLEAAFERLLDLDDVDAVYTNAEV
jgi:transcriptional/translational regulatory protein YebC/TACO1